MKKYEMPTRKLQDSLKLVVQRRSRSIAKSITKYPKKDFGGLEIDKAYLIGFRLGDLHVSKKKFGQTIMVATSTTKQAQLELMKGLFCRYGHFRINKMQKDCFVITFYLNESFDFLLKKEDNIEPWILEDNDSFSAFLAGHIDAEGHFGIYNGFSEFSIATYDKNILNQISKKLVLLGVDCPQPKITVKRGQTDKRGVPCNNDLWRVRITRKEPIQRLIGLIKTHVKHAKRFNDLKKVEQNILERNKRS